MAAAHPTANADLDKALAEAREAYVARHPRSRQRHEEACAVMPGGNTRTVLFHGPFPIVVEKGRGCRITDVDGFEYVDLLGEYTAGLFGHSDPTIRAAIDKALDGGINLGAHNIHEAQLARLVCERFPSVELVRFTNSGTEANLMALATARYATGRSTILVFNGGYHGGLLYFGGGGIPINAPYPFVVADYNDVEGTRRHIRENASTLAAVLVEPMIGSAGCIAATPDFLAMLREETRKAGAILIFDEVMTSRLSPGGLQKATGVLPDMTTLGKYIGGGMSFGAFGGRRDLMAWYDPRRPDMLPHAGTFNNNVLTMSAGVAGLSQVFTPEKAEMLNGRGDRLRQRLNEACRRAGARLQVTGVGSLMAIHPLDGPILRPADIQQADDRVRELLFLDLLESGYYMARRGFIALSLPIGDRELDGFAAAFDDFLGKRRSLVSG